jgi:hypothetical protein
LLADSAPVPASAGLAAESVSAASVAVPAAASANPLAEGSVLAMCR